MHIWASEKTAFLRLDAHINVLLHLFYARVGLIWYHHPINKKYSILYSKICSHLGVFIFTSPYDTYFQINLSNLELFNSAIKY